MKAKLLAITVAALVAAPAALAAVSSAPRRPAAAQATAAKTVTINLYASGDVNVQSLWQDNLIPGFEKANKGIKVKLIFSEHGTNDSTTLARIGAAVKQRKWPGIDLVDGGLVDHPRDRRADPAGQEGDSGERREGQRGPARRR